MDLPEDYTKRVNTSWNCEIAGFVQGPLELLIWSRLGRAALLVCWLLDAAQGPPSWLSTALQNRNRLHNGTELQDEERSDQ